MAKLGFVLLLALLCGLQAAGTPVACRVNSHDAAVASGHGPIGLVKAAHTRRNRSRSALLLFAAGFPIRVRVCSARRRCARAAEPHGPRARLPRALWRDQRQVALCFVVLFSRVSFAVRFDEDMYVSTSGERIGLAEAQIDQCYGELEFDTLGADVRCQG